MCSNIEILTNFVSNFADENSKTRGTRAWFKKWAAHHGII